MDLWNRSQDKTELVVVRTIGIEQVTDDEFSIEVNGYSRGDYETKERALEVLDEIQKLLMGQDKLLITSRDIDYLNGKFIKEHLDKDGFITVCNNDKIQYISPSTIVYEMPEN